MTPLERLRAVLAALNLKAIDARLETLLESASKQEPSYADFLLEVMSAESDARRQRYLKTRLQLAHLPYVKTFEQFDFGFQPSIDERQIRELRTLRFVHEASNVILLGPPGVGKTHLAVALAEASIQAGQAAYFMTAHDLVTDLGRAYREGRLDRVVCANAARRSKCATARSGSRRMCRRCDSIRYSPSASTMRASRSAAGARARRWSAFSRVLPWLSNGHWLRMRAWREARDDHARKTADHTRRIRRVAGKPIFGAVGVRG